MKILFISILFNFIFIETSHAGNINYYSPQNPDLTAAKPEIDEKSGNRTLSITPLDSCFSKLEAEEVANIKRHYLKPYKECLIRVAKKQRARQSLKFNKTLKIQEDSEKEANSTDK